ncbi:ras-associated and pleckstrin homology domains-containing protein 1-like isoform X3 [Oncorhynchus nerka]|uniref:ras-associated and pleckstrin homology domains-containing protein 1-like isoform X3 n=1 Tax=Oncorhynchus nerka TaxID=8023 RepID=UPI0031B8A4F6
MADMSDDELDHGAEEEDSDKEDQDLDKMFGAWLGELDKLTQSLDDGKPQKSVQKAPLRQETNMANFSYRFSMYNINEALNQTTETVDLDALMADLCSIEQELSTIGKPNTGTARQAKCQQRCSGGRSASVKQTGSGGGSSSGGSTSSSTRASPASTIRGGSSNSHGRPSASNLSLDDITAQLEQASLSMDEAAHQTSSSYSSTTLRRPSAGSLSSQHRRTGSVGTVSEHEAGGHSSRSSVNSASASSMDSLDIDKVLSRTVGGPEQDGGSQGPQPPQGPASTEHSYLDRETSLILKSIAGKPSHLLTKEEQGAKVKAEKIRVALEKIKEAQVKKLVIRVHMSDESSKTVMVDERQTVRQVLDSLLDKSHCGYSPDWALVETINELQMERIFEDHENLVENLLNWTRDSHNKLMFIERIEKYALFKNPQNYLLGRKETSEMADRNKEALLEECFCGSSVSVPEIEGILWLKDDGKKSWKKRYFLLRASGIYYVPKGKAKASRDLVCFLQLDHVNVYYGQDYRSKYKAPTDYCLALKHPQIQKKSQYIKYLCCDDVRTLHQWFNGIRIAKYGKQLYVNYQEAMKRTEAAYDWSSLSTSSIRSGSSSGSASLPESQSNHSGQSDSGVDTASSHGRSQSVVSSIFSEAWKRGTQMEENTRMRESTRGATLPHPVHAHRQTPQLEPPASGTPPQQQPPPQSRSSYTHAAPPQPQEGTSPLLQQQLPPDPQRLHPVHVPSALPSATPTAAPNSFPQIRSSYAQVLPSLPGQPSPPPPQQLPPDPQQLHPCPASPALPFTTPTAAPQIRSSYTQVLPSLPSPTPPPSLLLHHPPCPPTFSTSSTAAPHIRSSYTQVLPYLPPQPSPPPPQQLSPQPCSSYNQAVPPPPPPPPPPASSPAAPACQQHPHHSGPTVFAKYSTITRLQNQNAAHQAANLHRAQNNHQSPPRVLAQAPPPPHQTAVKPLVNNINVPPPPPPPPPPSMPALGSAMAALRLGPPPRLSCPSSSHRRRRATTSPSSSSPRHHARSVHIALRRQRPPAGTGPEVPQWSPQGPSPPTARLVESPPATPPPPPQQLSVPTPLLLPHHLPSYPTASPAGLGANTPSTSSPSYPTASPAALGADTPSSSPTTSPSYPTASPAALGADTPFSSPTSSAAVLARSCSPLPYPKPSPQAFCTTMVPGSLPTQFPLSLPPHLLPQLLPHHRLRRCQ